MAVASHSLESALGCHKPGSPHLIPINAAKKILLEHAPEVAAMLSDARWDEETQARVRKAIADLPQQGGAHRENVANAVAHVIAYGRNAGLWPHSPWPLRVISPLADGRLGARKQKQLDQVLAVRDKFLHRIPDLLRCSDRVVLQGAIVYSAAMTGGLMHADLLPQVLKLELQEFNGLHWFDLALGNPDRRVWRNPRRWFPDEVTLALIDAAGGRASRTDAAIALRAFADWLLVDPLTLDQLARASQLFWSTQLPSYLVEYGTQPQLGPSVPALVFKRMLTGSPLSRAQTRQIQEADPVLVDEVGPVEHEVQAIPPASRDAIRQRLAVQSLTRLLRTPARMKTPTRAQVIAALDAWNSEFGVLGGWVWLLGMWVRHTLDASRGRRTSGLRQPGLLRYLEGFARRWVQAMHDLPPERVHDAAEDVAERMAWLAEELARLNSAPVARSGLTQFLSYVERCTGVEIALGSEWLDVVPPADAVANLVTPVEFDRLLGALAAKLPVDSLPGMRVQVMACLAFVSGLRWELLHSLRYQDVFFTCDARALGLIVRRPNAYVQGKTPPRGGECLDHIMPVGHRVMLRRYLRWARRLAGAAEGDFVFADPLTPQLPPSSELTRDLIQQTLREVTGDPTMRFHDLRHSSANLAVVGVCWPKEPVPAVLEHLRSFSAQARGITQGSYTELVTKRSPEDRSGLYFVASVLDHSTPSTTMRSYVHVLDAVLAAEVGQRLVLARATKAALRGVGKDAVRKAEYRSRKRARKESRPAPGEGE